jgi:septal ring factor EnvC (AmiA/AmiB activator)
MMKYLLCIFLTFFSVLAVNAQDADIDPNALKEKLKEEQARAKKIEQQRVKLERNVEYRQQKLNSVKKNLRIYEYNLDQAQKVIDGAQKEIEGIKKRNLERLELFRACSAAIESHLLQNVSNSNVLQVKSDSVQNTAAQIAQVLFAAMKEEEPRLKELQRIVDEKSSYQQRIRNVYLPADLEKQETYQEVIVKNEEALQQTQAASVEISSSIQTLRNNLRAAQQKIESLQAAFQRTKAVATPAPVKSSISEQQKAVANTPQSATNRVRTYQSFVDRKGQLAWPAEGQLIRPFGEYTHPTLQVKMTNAGVDMETQHGAKIKAAADGEVMYAGEIPGMGEAVVIDHGGEYLTVYGNIKPVVQKNEWVVSGQSLGTVTVNSAGQTIYHFELRKGNAPLNPIAWLRRLSNL